MLFRPGSVFHGFRITRPLFSPGVGLGSEAVWLSTGNDGASYVVKVKSDASEWTRERDAFHLAGAHPNIAALVDEDPDTNVLVTQYTGTPLENGWKTRRVPPLQVVVDAAMEYAAGTEHLHSRGVAHLDLFVNNLTLPDEESAPETRPSIIDLGEARLLGEAPRAKRTYREWILDFLFDPDKLIRYGQPATFEEGRMKDVADLGRSYDKLFCWATLGYATSLIVESVFVLDRRTRETIAPLKKVVQDAMLNRIGSAKDLRERLGELRERRSIATYAFGH